MHYPGKELELFDKANFWRKYIFFKTKKFIKGDILEIGAGLGLLVGGLFPKQFLWEFGDAITRFSGVTICSIMTGVIWIGQPESFMDVILYDHFHVLLWVGGLFFALRGNRIYL